MSRALDRGQQPIAPGALGTGTPGSGNFLRGDGTWEAVQAGPETGDILTTARTLSEPDFLLADGSVYLQSSYPALFNIVGLLSIPTSFETWTFRNSGITASSAFGTGLRDVASSSSIVVVVGFDNNTADGRITTSPDGVTWTVRTTPISYLNCVAFGNGLFVAGSVVGGLATSPDGITWTSRTSGFGSDSINGAAFGNSTYVICGASGRISTSTDGITWTSRTSGTSQSLLSVRFINGLFVVTGNAGFLATSTDAITWTSRTSSFGSSSVQNVTYGNGNYVAVGGDGKIATSSDAITWTQVGNSTFGATVVAGVAFEKNTFIAVGNEGKIAKSFDSRTWISITPYSDSLRRVHFYNNYFIAVGDGSNTNSNPQGAIITSDFGYDDTTQFATPQIPFAFGATSYIKA
jgi:hypothetical protein